MSRDISIKLLFLSTISVIFTNLTTAQISESAGAWSLFGDLGETALSAGQSVIWYDIATLPDLAFFIAVWVATAAITLKFVNLIWSVITQRINLGSGSKYSVSHSSDGSGTLEKIVAISLSFIGAQYIGMVIGPLLAGTMLLLGSMMVISVGLIFYWFVLAGKDSLGRSSSSSSSGGFNIDVDIGGAAGEDVDEAGAAEDDAEKEEEAAGEETEAAEDDVESGNNEKADKEGRSAADHIEQALEDLGVAEKDIKDLLDRDYQQLNQTLKELEETLELDKDINEKLKSFQGKFKSLEKMFEKIDNDMGEDPKPAEAILLGHSKSPGQHTLEEWVDELEKMNEVIGAVSNEVHKEVEEEEQETKELLTEIEELLAAYKLIQRLKKDVEIAEKEDEELDQLANELGDRKLHEEVGYEENQEKELVNQLKKLVGEEEKIVESLERADSILTSIIGLDRTEIQELQRYHSEETAIMESMQVVHEKADKLYGGDPLPDTFESVMTNILDKWQAIGEQLQNVEEEKEYEEKKYEMVHAKVGQVLSQIEG